jgi:hypothetical protein
MEFQHHATVLGSIEVRRVLVMGKSNSRGSKQ